MAVGWSSTAANAALDEVAKDYTFIKLHIGDPGAAGTSNPAVETDRIQATWGTSSGGAMANTNALTWTAVAGSEAYTHFSAWTLVSAGVFGFSGTITANAVTAGDDFTIAIGDLDVSLSIAA